MNDSTDLQLRGPYWPLRLALGLLLAASLVLLIQQRSYQDEQRAFHEREQACHTCETSATE